MKPARLRSRLGYAFIAFSLLLPFQNCSQPTRYSQSGSSTASFSGGEAYGGKVYAITAETTDRLCSDGSSIISKIEQTAETSGLLLRENCADVTPPKPVTVSAGSTAAELIYNTASFHLVADFSSAQSVTLEAENMPFKSGGGLYLDTMWAMNEPQTISQPFQFTKSGTHTFAIQALSELADGVGAEIQVSIDGVAIGSVRFDSTALMSRSLQAPIAAGTHEVSLSFINDFYAGAGRDRNAYIDSVTITSP